MREIMALLKEKCHEITHDWTVETVESRQCVLNDINGVKAADALIVVLEQDLKYVGTLMEIGAALALGKPVYVLGDAPITNYMFFRHPLVRKIKSLEEIL